MYFVHQTDRWYPCTAGVENKDGTLQYRIEEDGGRGVISGTARPYHWAHATGDRLPNYHWFDEIINDQPREGSRHP
jgi:hypothetical protein